MTKQAVLRTLDNGGSWTAVFRPVAGEPRIVRRHPDRPGLAMLAIVGPEGSTIHVSRDLGEDWGKVLVQFKEEVFDAAWIERNGQPMLLVATEGGLRQIVPNEGGGATAVRVDQTIDPDGYWAVAATTSPLGVLTVAVAARKKKGVFVSTLGGVAESFSKRGLDGKDVRMLAVQKTGGKSFLWATVHTEGGEQGEGAQQLLLRDDGAKDPDGFIPRNIKWNGGSCEGIAFAGSLVFGASNRDGLHVLDTSAAKPAWAVASANSGLPIRDFDRFFEVVSTCAAAEVPGAPPLVLSGGVKGVHRSSDGGKTFSSVGHGLHTDRVPLSARWLYCTGTLAVTVEVDRDRRD